MEKRYMKNFTAKNEDEVIEKLVDKYFIDLKKICFIKIKCVYKNPQNFHSLLDVLWCYVAEVNLAISNNYSIDFKDYFVKDFLKNHREISKERYENALQRFVNFI